MLKRLLRGISKTGMIQGDGSSGLHLGSPVGAVEFYERSSSALFFSQTLTSPERRASRKALSAHERSDELA